MVVRVCVTGKVLAQEVEVKLVLSFPWIDVWSTFPPACFSSMLMGMVVGILATELSISLLHRLARAIVDLTILLVHEAIQDCHHYFIWDRSLLLEGQMGG